MKRTALDFLLESGPWGITEAGMEAVRAIAERKDLQPELYRKLETQLLDQEPEAITAKPGNTLPETRYIEMRGDVAVVTVEGPLYPKANLMTEFSGATSVQRLIHDLNMADASSDVSGGVLVFHTPGGVAKGIIEASGVIAGLKKPWTAYVSGLCCSAGFPLAAAANGGIVASPDATLGSLGVVLTIPPKRKDGPLEIVSSLSPDKRPDAYSNEGKAVYQKLVDELAAVFLARVAELRSTSVEHLVTARGGLLIGQHAVDFGLADRVGSLEEVISDLFSRRTPRRTYSLPGANPMDLQTLKANHPDVYNQAFDEGKKAGFDAGKAEGLTAGATTERQRITELQALAVPGHEKLIAEMIADGKTTPEQAGLKLWKAEQAALAQAHGDFRADLPNPVKAAGLTTAQATGKEGNEGAEGSETHLSANDVYAQRRKAANC